MVVTFVGLTKGDRTDDSDRASSSDDSIKSGFIGLTNDVVTNGCDKSSHFCAEFIFFNFLGGLSLITQSSGSVSVSSSLTGFVIS